ncbi:MAG: LURP-one-related/scramblase family protein [Anaerolineae bacterium]
MIYYIQQDFLSLGHSFTILDEFKQDAFYVQREMFTWGAKFSFKSDTGKELAYIKQETILFPTYSILINDAQFATITQEFNWFKKSFVLDVPGPNDYLIEGSFWLREYVFKRNEKVVASVAKQPFSIPHYYNVEIAKDEDVVSILATCIVIDQILNSN